MHSLTFRGITLQKFIIFIANCLEAYRHWSRWGKLKEITGLTRVILDKLKGIRTDLVRIDNDWQNLGFPTLTETLKGLTQRNPVTLDEQPISSVGNSNFRGHGAKLSDYTPANHTRRDKTFQIEQREWKRKCVYCDSSDHKSNQCENVREVSGRKSILRDKNLCCNCTGLNHRSVECKISSGCQVCHRRHHTSICDNGPQQVLLTTRCGSRVNSDIRKILTVRKDHAYMTTP